MKKGEEVTYDVSDEAPLAAFIFKTREDAYGKTSYIRVFGGVLQSDSRYWAAELDEEVRVGSLQIIAGKETSPIAQLHAGDIGAVVKLGDAGTNDTLCEKANILRIPVIAQPEWALLPSPFIPNPQSDVAKLSQSLNRLVAETPPSPGIRNRPPARRFLSGMGVTI
ncbi:MAG: hypothetical protein M5U34_02380 [Chloroflexi bacterium]|nr:hypothetical protein [Chloroflexota bacterium]